MDSFPQIIDSHRTCQQTAGQYAKRPKYFGLWEPVQIIRDVPDLMLAANHEQQAACLSHLATS